ncbi:MAG: tetratricopeptide repeat protein [Thermoanaerobaculia bacterium]
MRLFPPPEPIQRVVPAALLHLWPGSDKSAADRLTSVAARADGVFPAGTNRWLILPLPGNAAFFDRAVALGEVVVAGAAGERARQGASLLITPAAAEIGAQVTLLGEALLEEIAQRIPAIPAGKVLLTTHAAHHLEGSWAVEPSGNLTFGSGRLIPLAAVKPRAVAIPTWRNPEVLSRTAKWVPRPEVEEPLTESLGQPVVRVIGPFGVGKTRLVWEVMRAMGEPTIWRNAALSALQPGATLPSIVSELAAEPARPVWIIYDHLESAPPAVWAEIEELQKHPRLGDELRLVLLSRPAVAWPKSLATAPELRVGPLSPDAWARCSSQLFRGLSLPDSVAATLADGAGGNPFALEEALLLLVRDRRLRQVFGSFFFSGNERAETRFQPSRRFLAHAEAEAMRLGPTLPLRFLAQIATPIPADELRSAALALGGEAPPRQWDLAFREAGILVAADGPWGEGLSFASLALRQSYADTLRPASAAMLRSGLGELLAARSSAVEELWAAYELLRGTEAGARVLLAAASTGAKIPRDQLFTALRQELATHRERDGEPQLEVDLLWVLLPLARRMGRLHELAAALERGFELARDNAQRFLAIAALRAELAQMAGRYSEAEWVLRQALAGPNGDARRREMLLLELGRMLVRQGKTAEAGELFTKTLSVAEHLNRKGLASTCRFFLGNIAYHEFRLDDATALHQQALAARREKGTGVATSLSALGAVALAQGNFPSSLACFEEARQLLADEKSEAEEAFALVGVGRAMGRLGDFAGAAPVLRRALALREGRDDTVGEAIARLAVAENLLQLDQPDQALLEVRKAHFALSLVPPGEPRADAEQLLGRIQLRLRRHEAAITNLEEAARLHRELGKASSLLADLAYRIEAEIARGRPDGVRPAYELLSQERALLDSAPLRELSDFNLYLAAEWLSERKVAQLKPLLHLEKSYAELMRQTAFLAPAMRQRFLFQVPLHRLIVDAATRRELSLPSI